MCEKLKNGVACSVQYTWDERIKLIFLFFKVYLSKAKANSNFISVVNSLQQVNLK